MMICNNMMIEPKNILKIQNLLQFFYKSDIFLNITKMRHINFNKALHECTVYLPMYTSLRPCNYHYSVMIHYQFIPRENRSHIIHFEELNFLLLGFVLGERRKMAVTPLSLMFGFLLLSLFADSLGIYSIIIPSFIPPPPFLINFFSFLYNK